MNPRGRPIASLLFLGPSGSGKTQIVEATAEGVLRNPRAFVKIDFAEFQQGHEIAKLIWHASALAILDIKLKMVQKRIFSAAPARKARMQSTGRDT